MTICGYNAMMGRGIEILFEGMYEAISAKAEAERSDFRTILSRELIEIPRINAALTQGVGTPLKMFSGLNIMALGLFSALARSPGFDGSKTAFMDEIAQFVRTLEEVEDYTLSVPAQASDEKAIAARATAVGTWIVDTYSAEPA